MNLSHISDADVFGQLEEYLTSLSYPWDEIEKDLSKLVDPLEWSQIRLHEKHWKTHGNFVTDDPLILRRHFITLDVLRETQEDLARSSYSTSPEDLSPAGILEPAPFLLDGLFDTDSTSESDDYEDENDSLYWIDDYQYGDSDWSDEWEPNPWIPEDEEECDTHSDDSDEC